MSVPQLPCLLSSNLQLRHCCVPNPPSPLPPTRPAHFILPRRWALPSNPFGKMPVPPVDAFGIVYIIENAQQFWSGASTPSPPSCSSTDTRCISTELDDILRIPDYTTLSKLDGTLRRFISFCASFHGGHLVRIQTHLDAHVIAYDPPALILGASPPRQSCTYRAPSKLSTHVT